MNNDILKTISERLIQYTGVSAVKTFIIIPEDKQNSFWYCDEGSILHVLYRGTLFMIAATGNLSLTNKEGDIVYKNGVEIGEGLPFSSEFIKNDKNLLKLNDLLYSFDENNWYSLSSIDNMQNDIVVELDAQNIYENIKYLYNINNKSKNEK